MTQLRNKLGPVLAAALFGAALLILHHQLKGYDYREIVRSLREIPNERIAAAIFLTTCSYIVLTGYDVLALRFIGRPLPYPVAAMASFVGYAFSNNGGFPIVTGGSVRYRVYSAWGLTALDVAKIMLFCIATFWLGFLTLGAASFLLAPISVPPNLPLPFETSRPLGVLSLCVVGAYFALCTVRKTPVRVRGWEMALPSPRFALGQTVLATADLLLATGVLFMMLPAGTGVSYPFLAGVFVLAIMAGLVSQVPGGLGIFEAVVLVLLKPWVSGAVLMGSLLAYRAVYYLLPLVAAGGVLGAHELYRRRRLLTWVGRAAAPWAPLVAPQALAVMAFVGGGILMFSAATPPARDRFGWLTETVPLPALEVWHFLSAGVGAGLLLVARGLQERLRPAYYAAGLLLAAGVITALLKGLDYPEAILLLIMLAILLPSRAYFYRPLPLLRMRYTPAWAAALAATLVATLWLMSFAYKHVPYHPSIWTRVHVLAHESRSLRATAGAGAVLLLFAAAKRLRGSAPPQPELPGPRALEKARAVAAASRQTYSNLSQLGDKLFLFSDSGSAFLMYGMHGRTWAALGDPVGPAPEKGELAWRFRELCDRHGAWPAFYEADGEWLAIYEDIGLNVIELSEEARMPLEGFSLEDAARADLHDSARCAEAGLRFRVVPVEETPEWLPKLRAVADRWKAANGAPGRRFSVASFREDYAVHFAHAVAERDGETVGFGALWLGADRAELALDPVRYTPEAPPGTLEYLLAYTALWGASGGYRALNLGTAPLAGSDTLALAPLWGQLGALAYRHGEHFESTRDLRRFKERFRPEWRSKYLAAPGGLVLPRIIGNIGSLIASQEGVQRRWPSARLRRRRHD